MDTCVAGSARATQEYGPIQMLDGKIAKESKLAINREDAAMTHAGLLFTEALAAAHNAPDVRQDRIEAIRAQIASGDYEIDTKRLAENLIRENPGLFED